jgi:hypothetical protein
MMMKSGWILLFLSLFSVPVWAELKFVDLPQNCYAKKTYPCQVRISGGSLTIEREAQVLHLADQGAISFLSANELQFLSGAAWIEKANALTVKVSAVLKIQISGEWLLKKEKDATMVMRNLAGEARFLSDRVFPNEALPVGFQNWYGLLDTSGSVSRGMIRPIEVGEFLRDWLPMSNLSVAEMKHQISSYKERWKGALEQSAQLYAQVATRRIAAVEERERLKLEKAVSLRQEREKLRQMYRDRNGLSEPGASP